MEDLIDLILSNPLFIILIIGGLISLLKGGSGKKEEQNQPKPAPTQQTRQRERVVRPREETVHSISVEEQREKQMEHLSNHLESNPLKQEHSGLKNRTKVADAKRTAEIQSLHNTETKRQLREKFQKNLTRRGLVDSVVMSEVLGSPRARKPYQSVISKRK